MTTDKQQAAAAKEFAKRWQGRGYEKGESQLFWTDMLTSVFGVEDVTSFVRYEESVKVDQTNFIHLIPLPLYGSGGRFSLTSAAN